MFIQIVMLPLKKRRAKLRQVGKAGEEEEGRKERKRNGRKDRTEGGRY